MTAARVTGTRVAVNEKALVALSQATILLVFNAVYYLQAPSIAPETSIMIRNSPLVRR